MNVILMNYTPDPERAIAVAARLCYSSVGATELAESMTREQIERLLTTVLSNGHTSTLEHASFTFAIEGVSRACTHQLVRHRMASYNQQSQRYVNFDTDDMEVVLPNSIAQNEKAIAVYSSAILECKRAYHEMIEAGVPKEDARYVLPNAASSKLVVTMNARELMHFFSLRCCNRAQWEIRDLAWRMLILCQEVAPFLFKDAGPGCLNKGCPEGKMTCGNPYRKEA